MANPQHIEWLLEGVESWNARRERDDFVPDFSGSYDQIIDPVHHISHQGKQSKTGDLSANLTNTNFSEVRIEGLLITAVKLTRANFSGSVINKTTFLSISLSGASFVGAKSLKTSFNSTNCVGTNFESAILKSAFFSRRPS